MHVKRYGCGPIEILCLHGWSGDHRTFEPLKPFVPPEFTLVCPDLPGCGMSAAPRQWTLEAVVDELMELHRPHIIGNCTGALFGLMLSSRRKARSITLIDAFAYWPWYFRVFLAPGWGRHAYTATFANPVGRYLTNRSVARFRSSSTDLTEGFARVNHHATYRYLRLLSVLGSPEQFRGVADQVHVIHGEHTFGAIRRSAAIWKSIFPAARESVLKGAGHLPILEAAPELSRMVFKETACTLPSTNFAR